MSAISKVRTFGWCAGHDALPTDKEQKISNQISKTASIFLSQFVSNLLRKSREDLIWTLFLLFQVQLLVS
ncbi:hypothetical protein GQ457_05G015340 [Hibiscus cannabinus]